MSNLTLKGNTSGTGTVILETPNTNTNRTITLPDAATTLVGTADFATQAQAEAGTDNTTLMTPLRAAQAIGALSTFTREYVSSNQTITSGGLLTLAHGLGQVPKSIQLYLVCTTAEGGWAVGDVILVGNNNGATSDNRHTSVYNDETNLYVRFTTTAACFTVANKGTGGAVTVANTSFRLIVRAFA